MKPVLGEGGQKLVGQKRDNTFPVKYRRGEFFFFLSAVRYEALKM